MHYNGIAPEPRVTETKNKVEITVAAGKGNGQTELDEEEDLRTGSIGCCGVMLVILSCMVMVITFPFSLFLAVRVVSQFERAVILRLGLLRSRTPMGPGLFAVLPCTDTFVKIDLRTLSYDVPAQQMLTSDSVTVTVDAVMFYQVKDPVLSVIKVEDAHRATKLVSQTILRNVVGGSSLTELLGSRDRIAEKARQIMDSATDPWGISIERLEIKDVRLPESMQRAMAAEAEATRDAKAKVILAEGEHTAAGSLKAAADTIASSPGAIQLKYLQTLASLGDGGHGTSTIVFPVPVDLLQGLIRRP